MPESQPASEITPLLASPASGRPLTAGALKPNMEDSPKTPSRGFFWDLWQRLAHVEARILMAGFLITLSFSYTQVSLLHVFHLIECDVYYESHPPYVGHGDRCSINEVAAGTARQYSILGMSTTVCGIMNLFFSGWLIKRIGPRATLMFQTAVPALRVLLQITGVITGGRLGMIIIQTTQAVTIFGGPAGYVLVVNVFIGEIVEASRRTATFGRLQGCVMLGMSVGFIVGGQIGNIFGVLMPFRLAFVSFLTASLYTLLFLPYIDPAHMSGARTGSSNNGLFAPLRILKPQLARLASGRIVHHYGVGVLCAGIFAGVVATGYAPLLIQMYATAVFDFSQGDNGLLMSEFSFVRSLFLIFVFPRIISWGRRHYAPRRDRLAAARRAAADAAGMSTDTTPRNGSQSPSGYGTIDVAASSASETDTLIVPTHPEEVEVAAPNAVQVEAGPIRESDLADGEPVDLSFDLVFLRWSLVVDGAMTTLAAFATQKWHIYLAAFLIPLGSGSAPAAKGVITDMCTASQRADALNAVTLVENMANLTTQGLFGYAFAALAARGVAHMTFFCNAAIALLAMAVLLFSRFPPVDCVLIDDEAEFETQGQSNQPQAPGN
ncbi:uncharacterized protein BROUX77_006928 [Berkeleyomyces rouxiae]|uniref:uncharacterized protein n=1 Tax=Berkeleyomyces rouxiae TaxID=2035830 RepID=UPI003B7E123F